MKNRIIITSLLLATLGVAIPAQAMQPFGRMTANIAGSMLRGIAKPNQGVVSAITGVKAPITGQYRSPFGVNTTMSLSTSTQAQPHANDVSPSVPVSPIKNEAIEKFKIDARVRKQETTQNYADVFGMLKKAVERTPKSEIAAENVAVDTSKALAQLPAAVQLKKDDKRSYKMGSRQRAAYVHITSEYLRNLAGAVAKHPAYQRILEEVAKKYIDTPLRSQVLTQALVPLVNEITIREQIVPLIEPTQEATDMVVYTCKPSEVAPYTFDSEIVPSTELFRVSAQELTAAHPDVVVEAEVVSSNTTLIQVNAAIDYALALISELRKDITAQMRSADVAGAIAIVNAQDIRPFFTSQKGVRYTVNIDLLYEQLTALQSELKGRGGAFYMTQEEFKQCVEQVIKQSAIELPAENNVRSLEGAAYTYEQSESAGNGNALVPYARNTQSNEDEGGSKFPYFALPGIGTAAGLLEWIHPNQDKQTEQSQALAIQKKQQEVGSAPIDVLKQAVKPSDKYARVVSMPRPLDLEDEQDSDDDATEETDTDNQADTKKTDTKKMKTISEDDKQENTSVEHAKRNQKQPVKTKAQRVATQARQGGNHMQPRAAQAPVYGSGRAPRSVVSRPVEPNQQGYYARNQQPHQSQITPRASTGSMQPGSYAPAYASDNGYAPSYSGNNNTMMPSGSYDMPYDFTWPSRDLYENDASEEAKPVRREQEEQKQPVQEVPVVDVAADSDASEDEQAEIALARSGFQSRAGDVYGNKAEQYERVAQERDASEGTSSPIKTLWIALAFGTFALLGIGLVSRFSLGVAASKL